MPCDQAPRLKMDQSFPWVMRVCVCMCVCACVCVCVWCLGEEGEGESCSWLLTHREAGLAESFLFVNAENVPGLVPMCGPLLVADGDLHRQSGKLRTRG
jgi:hypothetical protein